MKRVTVQRHVGWAVLSCVLVLLFVLISCGAPASTPEEVGKAAPEPKPEATIPPTPVPSPDPATVVAELLQQEPGVEIEPVSIIDPRSGSRVAMVQQLALNEEEYWEYVDPILAELIEYAGEQGYEVFLGGTQITYEDGTEFTAGIYSSGQQAVFVVSIVPGPELGLKPCSALVTFEDLVADDGTIVDGRMRVWDEAGEVTIDLGDGGGRGLISFTGESEFCDAWHCQGACLWELLFAAGMWDLCTSEGTMSECHDSPSSEACGSGINCLAGILSHCLCQCKSNSCNWCLYDSCGSPKERWIMCQKHPSGVGAVIIGEEVYYACVDHDTFGKQCQAETIEIAKHCPETCAYEAGVPVCATPTNTPGPTYIGYDDCAHAPEPDTCCCGISEHIHDLGALFPSETKVKVRYMPGTAAECAGSVSISVSATQSFWTPAATESFPSGYGMYSSSIVLPQEARYVRVSVDNCYLDWSSAAVYVEERGATQDVRVLDFGVSLVPNTPIIVRGTAGTGQGCSGTASIGASDNGTDWTDVGGSDYVSYQTVGGGGWRTSYKTTVVPAMPFRYANVAHSGCSNDVSSVEVAPYGYREYYAIIIGGQTDKMVWDGEDRHYNPSDFPFYTWYWNATSSMYEGLIENYRYPTDNVYFLFEEGYSGDLDKDTAGIHDRDSLKTNVQQVLDHVSHRTDDDDLLFLFWVGHGEDTPIERFLLPGEEFPLNELAPYLDNIAGEQVLAFSPCHSGCVINDISQEHRTILTSVVCEDGNNCPWAEMFRDGLLGSAERDDRGDISMAAAFEYAADRMHDPDWICQDTDKPLLDDNGDNAGHHYNADGYDPDDAAKDGYRAARINLGHFVP